MHFSASPARPMLIWSRLDYASRFHILRVGAAGFAGRLAAALSTSYVVVVVLPSWFFPHAPLGAAKTAGLLSVTVGAGLLSCDARR